jgi:hypothetical protein
MPSQDGEHKRPKHIDNFRGIVAFECKGRTGREPGKEFSGFQKLGEEH